MKFVQDDLKTVSKPNATEKTQIQPTKVHVSKNKKIQPVGLAGEMRKKKKQIEARLKTSYAPGFSAEEYKDIIANWEEKGGMIGRVNGDDFYYHSGSITDRDINRVQLKTTETLKIQIENLKMLLAKRDLIVKNHLENNKVNDSISMVNESSLYENDHLDSDEIYKDRENAAKQRCLINEDLHEFDEEREKLKQNNYTVKNNYIPKSADYQHGESFITMFNCVRNNDSKSWSDITDISELEPKTLNENELLYNALGQIEIDLDQDIVLNDGKELTNE